MVVCIQLENGGNSVELSIGKRMDRVMCVQKGNQRKGYESRTL